MKKIIKAVTLISLMTLFLTGCGKKKDVTVAEISTAASYAEVVSSTADEEKVNEAVVSDNESSIKEEGTKNDDTKKNVKVESKSDSSIDKKEDTEEVKGAKKEEPSKEETKNTNSSIVSDPKKDEPKKEDSKPTSSSVAVTEPKKEDKPAPSTSVETPKKEENNPVKVEEKVPEHKHEYTPGLGRYAMRQKDGEPCAIEAQTWNTCSICGEEYVQVPWGLYTYEHTIETTYIGETFTGFVDYFGQLTKEMEKTYSNICSVCGYDRGITKSWDYVPCSEEEFLEYVNKYYPPSPDEEEPVEEPPVWEEITEEEP